MVGQYSVPVDTIHHEGDYSAAEIAAQLLEALKAHSEYIKSRTVYFDFRNLGVRESRYLAALEDAVQQIPAQDRPEEVVTWESRE